MVDFKLFEQPLGEMDDYVNKTIVSADIGGGWYAAASTQLRMEEGRITAVNPHLLKLRDSGGPQDDYLESNLTFWQGAPYLTGDAQAVPLYTNYKDIPSTINLRTQVKPGDPLNRREAIRASTQAIIEAICENNPDIRQKLESGEVIFYIGHPSSERWTDDAVIRNYCALMEEAIEAAGYKARCMTFQESRGAIFYARRKDASITDKTTVMIIDIGASTVDITFIRPTAFLQRDASETLGGRDLDAALLALVLRKAGLTMEDLEDGCEASLLYLLRTIKEDFYPSGQMREDSAEATLRLPLRAGRFAGDQQSVSVTITAEDMKAVFADSSDASPAVRLRSFLAGFLDELGESAQSIDRVILTGGTANVSQVRETIGGVLAERIEGFDAKTQVISLIGLDDTLGAVAIGGLDLMVSNLRVSAAFDALEKQLTRRLCTEPCLSAAFHTRLAAKLKAECSFLDVLYVNAYKPWAEDSNNLSLKTLNERCKNHLLQCRHRYTAIMRDCLSAALDQEMRDENGFFSLFTGFFAALGIRFDNEADSSLSLLRGTVQESLHNAIQPLTSQMTDCVASCNSDLNTNPSVIKGFVTTLRQMFGGIINILLNILRNKNYLTQPRYQSTRKLFCDYEHGGQALREYIADDLFGPKVDDILKAHLQGCDRGMTQPRGEALRDKILTRITPCLRNAIFMANSRGEREDTP